MILTPSRSGLFELWVEVVIEGDCITPTRCHNTLIGRFQTSEDLIKATDAEYNCTPNSVVYGLNQKFPADYVARHNKLAAKRRLAEQAERDRLYPASEVPF